MSGVLRLGICVLAAGVLVGACAESPAPRSGGVEQAPERSAPPLDRVREAAIEAGMPPDQLEAALDIARDARTGRRALLAELDAASATLADALATDPLDEETVIAAVEVVSDVERALRVHNMRTLLAMHAAVDPQWRGVLGTMTPGSPDAAPRRDPRRPR